ncbi:MAG TPA: tRNA-binding protein [Dehalococcoidia bacterium]|nr:tRNA-binding protein [Dehalococcoidia bacterium]
MIRRYTREVPDDGAALIDAAQFFAVDIRVGRVLRCEAFPEARQPAYKLSVDFGPLGVRRSSARLTHLYTADELVGRLVIGVVNLPPRQVGPVRSEVLVLGVYRDGSDEVVLLQPERACTPGDRVG